MRSERPGFIRTQCISKQVLNMRVNREAVCVCTLCVRAGIENCNLVSSSSSSLWSSLFFFHWGLLRLLYPQPQIPATPQMLPNKQWALTSGFWICHGIPVQWDVPDTTYQEPSRGHPFKAPEPPQLAPLDLKEKQLYFEALLDCWAPHPITKSKLSWGS